QSRRDPRGDQGLDTRGSLTGTGLGTMRPCADGRNGREITRPTYRLQLSPAAALTCCRPDWTEGPSRSRTGRGLLLQVGGSLAFPTHRLSYRPCLVGFTA